MGTCQQASKQGSGKPLRRAATKVEDLQVWTVTEQFLEDFPSDITFNMFLQQAFLEVGKQVQAVKQVISRQFLNLIIHLLGPPQPN